MERHWNELKKRRKKAHENDREKLSGEQGIVEAGENSNLVITAHHREHVQRIKGAQGQKQRQMGRPQQVKL